MCGMHEWQEWRQLWYNFSFTWNIYRLKNGTVCILNVRFFEQVNSFDPPFLVFFFNFRRKENDFIFIAKLNYCNTFDDSVNVGELV